MKINDLKKLGFVKTYPLGYEGSHTAYYYNYEKDGISLNTIRMKDGSYRVEIYGIEMSGAFIDIDKVKALLDILHKDYQPNYEKS